MKTPDKIREKLEEFRKERLVTDTILSNSLLIGDLGKSSIAFERVVTLEGGIEALKWVLKEVDNEE